MFLSVDTGIIIVGAIIAAILVFLLCDNLIKGKKRKQRLEEYRKKVQQEKEEQEQKKRLEQEAKEKKINEFNAQHSEESIQEHILEYEDELKARTQIFIDCAERVIPNSSESNAPKVRFNRNHIAKASTYEILREEYLNKDKYNRFTFEKCISFYQCLVKHLDEKCITEPELYNAAGIQRQTFYKIKSIEGYVPRRRTVFYFILYLKLTIEEANELLSLAGYQLNPSSKIESYIKYCIENQMYDIDEINDFLYDHFNEVL